MEKNNMKVVALLDYGHKKLSACGVNEEKNTSFSIPQKLLLPFDEQAKYNLRVKHFPYGDEYLCVSKPVFNPNKVKCINNESSLKERKKRSEDDIIEERADSIKRSKDKVKEIAFSNPFNYWVTLTLDSRIISRTDISEVQPKLENYLKNEQYRHGVKYLLVPELHERIEEDGKHAMHFHALMMGDLKLSFSGLYDSHGKKVYNLDSWKYGFSKVVEIDPLSDDYCNNVFYLIKYISKDMQKVFSKRYFSSRGLKRSVPTEYHNVSYSDFEGKEYIRADIGLSFKYLTDND